VAVRGRTTGSHLGLADDQEIEQSLMWLATVVDGAVDRCQLVADDEANRRRFAC